MNKQIEQDPAGQREATHVPHLLLDTTYIGVVQWYQTVLYHSERLFVAPLLHLYSCALNM
jgi:hypothetical protein